MSLNRRKFVSTGVTALGAGFFIGPAMASTAVHLQSMTVQDVIDLVIKQVPGAPFNPTVDTLKAGKPDQAVTGIVTTMFATIKVIHKAIALNANFIIAHEPTFYNHLDETKDFVNDSVYRFKRDLLDKHGIAVWRCHDYIHAFQPDGVLNGVLNSLEWGKFYDPKNPHLITLAPDRLEKIVEHVKAKLKIPHVRVCGSLDQSCSRIAVMPGAAGGKRQIGMVMDQHPDLLICGELSEWETAEYIRDSIGSGLKRSLIILGHAVSEEPGMTWMAGWLAPQVQRIPVTHIASNDPFIWV